MQRAFAEQLAQLMNTNDTICLLRPTS